MSGNERIFLFRGEFLPEETADIPKPCTDRFDSQAKSCILCAALEGRLF
jgi:hypothetical protein